MVASNKFGNKDELHAKLSTFISPNKTQIEFGVSLCKVNVIRMTKEPFRLQDLQVKSILKANGAKHRQIFPPGLTRVGNERTLNKCPSSLYKIFDI